MYPSAIAQRLRPMGSMSRSRAPGLSLFGASPGSGGHRKTTEAPFSSRIGTFRRRRRLFTARSARS
jgi:hypothetical protein